MNGMPYPFISAGCGIAARWQSFLIALNSYSFYYVPSPFHVESLWTNYFRWLALVGFIDSSDDYFIPGDSGIALVIPGCINYDNS